MDNTGHYHWTAETKQSCFFPEGSLGAGSPDFWNLIQLFLFPSSCQGLWNLVQPFDLARFSSMLVAVMRSLPSFCYRLNDYSFFFFFFGNCAKCIYILIVSHFSWIVGEEIIYHVSSFNFDLLISFYSSWIFMRMHFNNT